MSYQVTRTVKEVIIVEGRDFANALDEATDYSNEHRWEHGSTVYSVEEL